jgi:hypothetical protein
MTASSTAALSARRAAISSFDVGVADILATELHEVEQVELKTKEAADPYFVEKQPDGSIRLIQNVITAIGPVDGPMIELA